MTRECEKLQAHSLESRKAWLEKQNRIIKSRTKEPSILNSSIFSYDISLNSLSLKTESDDLRGSTFRNLSSRSRKPSEILLENKSFNFSEKDEKILRLMAARREAKMEQAELAFSAINVWEEDRIQRHKRTEENKKKLMQYLEKKNKLEELEKIIRKRDQQDNWKQERKILEMKITEKHKRVEMKQKEMLMEKKLKADRSTTESQLFLHRERKKIKEREEEAVKALNVKTFQAKEKRSEEKLKSLFMERSRKLKEESVLRELKWQAAKTLRTKLNEKLENDRLMSLRKSEKTQALQQQRLNWVTEWKRKLLMEKNEREKQEHMLIFAKLKEEEKEKVNLMKRKIQVKYMKMKSLQEKKEAALLRSRLNERTCANLRQKLQATYEL